MSDNTVISILGQKGSGKSTLAKRIIGEYPRVICLDTLGEYDECEQYFDFDSCVLALEKHETAPRFALSFRLDDTEDYLDLMTLCYEIPDHLLVMEEVSFYCSPTMLPVPLSKLVRYGRKRRISQLYISRRPSEMHRDLTAQSDLIVSFRQHEPRDVMYLTSVAGEDASRVRTLREFRCAAWGDMSKAPLAVIEKIDRTGEQSKLPLDDSDRDYGRREDDDENELDTEEAEE